jgi:hypothetical protein
MSLPKPLYTKMPPMKQRASSQIVSPPAPAASRSMAEDEEEELVEAKERSRAGPGYRASVPRV